MALVYPYNNNVRHKGDIYQQNDLILLQCILIVGVVYSSRKVQKHVTSRPHSADSSLVAAWAMSVKRVSQNVNFVVVQCLVLQVDQR